ncbi:nitrate/sulfonate/bicarbonate ABC transporter ATP-binding protein [Duganella sp. Root1480D1]|uniref:ABC transporter ATP-binding protein n=1 Tax=Duganella sp. Root1480D1 TaxID=1736471 RepID=UPI0007090259|nr:nitrate/sulfonate/bicarbonate ABC transporter ATP-binding protein [Duganella sp. Root1480D1]KQZ26889.1 nitrate ABC transporter ATP-binding protein [Duganella sp. Root1480D1]
MKKEILVDLQGVGKSFRTGDGASRTVLDGVDFALESGEIVALLGKSGSGKSTLLRIIAGLVQADAGAAKYRGAPLAEPVPGIAMVFQSFALFPWLTVQQNVELGLEAQGVAADERAARSGAMLDLMGLSGFEGALPRELSGGMRQRVGIARALVTNPDVLLMDEAFSALDVLTGETLRDDILELWDHGRIPTRGILVVSHNIEEAVMMSDRIIMLSSDPGRIRTEIRIDLPRPRNPDSPAVRQLVDEVYGLMTMRAPAAVPAREAGPDYRLPDADIERIEAVLSLLASDGFNGRADLPRLSDESELPDEALFPACEALSQLGLATVEGGDITMTTLGRRYEAADHAGRQAIFGRQLLAHVTLPQHIYSMLRASADGALPEEQVLSPLLESNEPEEARRIMRTAVEWGRYGEIYEFDFHTRRLRLA